jgi:tRNA dimethylallyltransferase
MKKNNIIIISGPTASGKTSISIELAKSLEAEIVNFDSLLFYKELLIGNARPTNVEMEGVPHHLVATHSIASPINAADFMREAISIINEIHSRDKVVILVGGSGFYLQAILNGMYESKTTRSDITEKSDRLYQDEGIKPFRDILEEFDQKSFDQYHENDHYRNRRAVEHYWTTGSKFSDSRSEMSKRLENSPTVKFCWRTYHCYLDLDKPDHFEIILKRTKKMLEDGLINEVKKLIDCGFTGQEKPLNSIGYKETFDYLNEKYSNLDEYSERISINTRRLAKSQRTWFKKVEKVTYHPINQREDLLADCIKFIRE